MIKLKSFQPFNVETNIDPDNPSRPGIAVAWRHNVPVVEVSNLVLCRLQVITLGYLKLINIYAPSGSEKRQERAVFFGEHVFEAVQFVPEYSLLLSGDYNSVIQSIDIEGGVGFGSKKCPALADLVHTIGLKDAFRHLHPSKMEFTFFRPRVAP